MRGVKALSERNLKDFEYSAVLGEKPITIIPREDSIEKNVDVIIDITTRVFEDPEFKETVVITQTNETVDAVNHFMFRRRYPHLAKLSTHYDKENIYVGEVVRITENCPLARPSNTNDKTLFSSKLDNGDMFVIKSIYDVRTDTGERTLVNSTKAPVDSPRVTQRIVQFDKDNQQLNTSLYPSSRVITRGYCGTTYSQQGNQELNVICLIPNKKDHKTSTYTRKEFYVACSRQQNNLVIMGTMKEIEDILQNDRPENVDAIVKRLPKFRDASMCFDVLARGDTSSSTKKNKGYHAEEGGDDLFADVEKARHALKRRMQEST
jgi:ribosomal protein S17